LKLKMPEKTTACEPLLGSDDGKWIFESIFAALKNKTVAQAARSFQSRSDCER